MTAQVRARIPDAVLLDPTNPELVRLVDAGVITYDQCYEAHARGALFYSPSLNRFVNVETEPPPP